MKKVLPIVLFICMIVSVSVLSPNKVFACSCGEPSVQERYKQSSVVLTGTLVSKDKEGGNIFSVDKVWKGNLEDGYVHSGFYGVCGTEFDVGKKYLIFTYNHKGKELTSLCSGNKLITEASKDIEALNQLTNPEWGNKYFLIFSFLIVAAILIIIWRVKLRFKNN
ncbi:hypothetical protein [Paenibacillus terrigena]|uniref:hypothetical protein n=1 Tax=Paenibacillus terrigena TaxID=369333 RepID=UPI0003707A49|nr:hypothetical protein [Paenibacillus terrigena]